MVYKNKYMPIKTINMQQTTPLLREFSPDDIYVPKGYNIQMFANGLDTPIGLAFTDNGELLIADSGAISGNPKIIMLVNGEFKIIADGFQVPLTGISYRNSEIYASHKGTITIVKLNGEKKDIIKGLPSYGDYCTNKVTFGPYGKMYFGQGTATNSGVVGLDNKWVIQNSFFHDYPGSYIMLNGQNFVTDNILIPAQKNAITGAFSPFSVPNLQKYEILKGAIQASGSILRANPDGSDLELVAWGFRNPVACKFDIYNRLFVSNQSYDVRGSRPIANAPDELQLIIPGTWYGWPDYAGGELITLPKFAPKDGPKPELLFTNHPSVPPKPFATFTPYSNIMGFDINYNPSFSNEGDLYIAEFGGTSNNISSGSNLLDIGHRIIKVSTDSGKSETFAINKSGYPALKKNDSISGGGLSRPTDIIFGPDGAMYVSDFAISAENTPYEYLPNTGCIWKIIKEAQ